MHDSLLWDVCTSLYFPQRISIRSPKTVRQYRFAVQDFGKFLERPAKVRDLTDEQLTGMLTWLLRRGRAPKTCNERVGRLRTVWTWLAKRGHLEAFPTVERVPEPRRLPQAWTSEQLKRLFWSCSQEDRPVGDVPGHLWWIAFHALAWNTAERVGALLAARWSDLDVQGGTLFVPGHIRKGGLADMLYILWPETLAALERIYQPPREILLYFPNTTFYYRYARILKRAGLPDDRRCKAHKMRVSHASHSRAMTGQSAESLGHQSESTTRRFYEDPRICRKETPRLFIPWEP